MRSFIESLTLTKRILIIKFTPLIGLVVVASIAITQQTREARQAARQTASLQQVTELGTLAAATIHQLQKERGRTAGYLGSGGKKFGPELEKQRSESDLVITTLSETAATQSYTAQGQSFQSKLARGLDLLQNLPVIRKRASAMEIDTPAALGSYTETINTFLDLIDISATRAEQSEIALLFVSYGNFLRAKENMGLERAVLSNAFGADAFKGDILHRFDSVLAKQLAYLGNFKSYATPEHWQAYQTTVRGPAVDRVEAYRKIAYSKAATGGFGVEPGEWFAQITKKIDLMKKVEDGIAQDVLASARSIQSNAKNRLLSTLAATVIVIIATLAVSFIFARSAVKSFKLSVIQLNKGVDKVSNAATEVSQASVSMADGTREQSSALSQTNQSLKSIAETTAHNSELASDANRITTNACQMVDRSFSEMRKLQDAMEEIRESSDEISAIIKTIDEIAFQTNILALNAAVEAARAGESGAGFAVVADEVRNLAQRSAQAAQDTTQKIEDSIQRANNGSKISTTVGEDLSKIVEKVREVDGVVGKIDDASGNQLDAIRKIQSAVEQQEAVVQNASGTTEQTSTAALELRSQTQEMHQSILRLAAQTGVPAEQLELASQSHAFN